MHSQHQDFLKFEWASCCLPRDLSFDCPFNRALTGTNSRFTLISRDYCRFRTCFEQSSSFCLSSVFFDPLDFLVELSFKVNLQCFNTKMLLRGNNSWLRPSCNLNLLFNSCLILAGHPPCLNSRYWR